MKKCPICKKPMEWQEGLLSDGHRDMTVGRYYCKPCKLAHKMQDSKGVIKGKKLAHEFIGVSAMDKRILALPTAVQIGLLRERHKKNL